MTRTGPLARELALLFMVEPEFAFTGVPVTRLDVAGSAEPNAA